MAESPSRSSTAFVDDIECAVADIEAAWREHMMNGVVLFANSDDTLQWDAKERIKKAARQLRIELSARSETRPIPTKLSWGPANKYMAGYRAGWNECVEAMKKKQCVRNGDDHCTPPCCTPSRNDAAPMPFSAPGEPSTLDMTTPRDNLRWALSAMDLVANGLRNRRNLELTDVEMRNLRAAKVCVEQALEIIRSETPASTELRPGSAAPDGSDAAEEKSGQQAFQDGQDAAREVFGDFGERLRATVSGHGNMTSFAWLIEIPTERGPAYWTGVSGWSLDPFEALRFARKADAEKLLEYDRVIGHQHIGAVPREHSFQEKAHG